MEIQDPDPEVEEVILDSSTSKSAAVNLRAESEDLALNSSADTIPLGEDYPRRFSQEYEFVDLSQDAEENWNALEAEAEAYDRLHKRKKSKFVDSQASSTSDVESDSSE